MIKYSSAILFLSLFCLVSTSTDYYNLSYPDYFPDTAYDFDKSPLSATQINLGRALFYDPILSKDSTISCASCHSPYNAFAHTDHDLSHGINDKIGTRNAPALFNLAWQKSFMWDGAINHLDMQSLAPISHPDEMGEDIKNVVIKLQRKKIYPLLFEKAFGDTLITGEYILKSLAQFQLTLVSANAKYDAVKNGETEFTAQEKNGYELYKKNCSSCHTEPLFSTYEFANNGLPVDTTLNDFGKIKITQFPTDSLLFKIPSLRNLSFTAPYMHDGRFRKLKNVIKHYNDNIQNHPTLSPQLEKSPNFSVSEQTDLITFLRTLNDKEFVFNKDNKYPIEIFHIN
ncbi:MAG: cytochrome-c peroxidase [Saprospiraceae bacterium]